MKDEMQKVVIRIEKILLNPEEKPLDTVGSLIVGATIARDDYEQLCEQYPLLSIISELGADLETLENDAQSIEVVRQMNAHLEALDTSIKNTR